MNTQHTSQTGQLQHEPLTHRPEKADLKSERVQDAAEIEERLRDLPGWKLGAAGTGIRRARKFSRPEDAAAFVAFVGSMATSNRQPVTICLTGRLVLVVLTGRRAPADGGGLTERTFKLAAMIG